MRGHHLRVSPPVSIVITNHNYAEFVGEAIDSALGQRGVEVEVVVIDDGSTDESRRRIERYGTKVAMLFTPNNGQGAAFNCGFAESHGDIVFFLDADDVLRDDTAHRVVEAFDADLAVVRVQFALDVIDADGKPTGDTVPPHPKVPFSGDARPRLLSCPDDIVWQPTSGNAFRRSALAAILPMPEEPYRLCADYYLSSLAPLHGRVAVLDDPGGGYRVHGANAHYSDAEQPDRLRTNIRRTHETHVHLIAESNRLGLTGLPREPADVRSVSFVANRMLSYRHDRAQHPIAGDTRRTLLRLGVSSAFARTDVPLPRRLAFAAWFAAMAVVPRRFVRVVARPFARLA